MIIGKKGIDLIKHFEGFKAKPYLCPAGRWTIGYGTTDGITKDTAPVSEAEAEALLRKDVSFIERGLERIIPGLDGLQQDQFDALCSFCYNLSIGAFQGSTLRKVVIRNHNDFPAIRKEFMRWVNVSGRKMNGLVKRREAEANLYCDGAEVE
ncbi:MAG: lysozyme [Bacteroides sp.]|nr:lysozyme [Bacteroides sp.]